MKAFIWNIRSVNTQKAFTRLIQMHKRQQYWFMGLMEPFEDWQGLEECRRRLGMKHAVANSYGKIWVFIDRAMEYEITGDEDQILTWKVQHQGMGIEAMFSIVYAKCTQGERLSYGNLCRR